MIINIPLQIDEATFEQKVREDYAKNVKELLLNKVDEVLKEYDNRYYTQSRSWKNGMEYIITQEIDIFINDHKDEIVEMAADKLAERLARTKKAKAILDSMEAK